MRILVTGSKNETSARISKAYEAIRQKIGDKAEITRANKLDWNSIRRGTSGWRGLPSWVARNFETVIVLETARNGLGRGSYDIARACLAQGRSVGVFRDGKIVRVTSVRLSGEDDWKAYYGVVVTT